MPKGSCIITNEGHHDTCITCLVFNILHIFSAGERDRDSNSVLVLRLVEYDRAAIRDLCSCNYSVDSSSIAAPGQKYVYDHSDLRSNFSVAAK